MTHCDRTAILLIGIQNDHFSQWSPLRSMIESPNRIDTVKQRILTLLDGLAKSSAMIINLPILFRKGHPEITQEIGILHAIKQADLFIDGTPGGCLIPELAARHDRTVTLVGRTGFNSFVDTGLHEVLMAQGIRRIVLAGVSTAGCIDSTARCGYELGYDVVVLEDCTIARTPEEQVLYCQTIFPIYSRVMTARALMDSMRDATTATTASLAAVG